MLGDRWEDVCLFQGSRIGSQTSRLSAAPVTTNGIKQPSNMSPKSSNIDFGFFYDRKVNIELDPLFTIPNSLRILATCVFFKLPSHLPHSQNGRIYSHYTEARKSVFSHVLSRLAGFKYCFEFQHNFLLSIRGQSWDSKVDTKWQSSFNSNKKELQRQSILQAK